VDGFIDLNRFFTSSRYQKRCSVSHQGPFSSWQ
jgi:hypothetical protein